MPQATTIPTGRLTLPTLSLTLPIPLPLKAKIPLPLIIKAHPINLLIIAGGVSPKKVIISSRVAKANIIGRTQEVSLDLLEDVYFGPIAKG
jgi:hypothetical protein